MINDDIDITCVCIDMEIQLIYKCNIYSFEYIHGTKNYLEMEYIISIYFIT
jgi:hypothetical protein